MNASICIIDWSRGYPGSPTGLVLHCASVAHLYGESVSLNAALSVSVPGRLLEVGAELSGHQGGPLEEAVQKQCVAFFRVYHRARLEELRMFLENEAWEVCPVKPTFSVHSLQVSRCPDRNNRTIHINGFLWIAELCANLC